MVAKLVIHFNFNDEGFKETKQQKNFTKQQQKIYILCSYVSKYVHSSCLQQEDTYSRIGAEIENYYSIAGEV